MCNVEGLLVISTSSSVSRDQQTTPLIATSDECYQLATVRCSYVNNTWRSHRWQHAMKPDIRRESRFVPTPPAFEAPLVGSPSEYCHITAPDWRRGAARGTYAHMLNGIVVWKREGKNVCVRVLGKLMYSFVNKCTYIYTVLLKTNCVYVTRSETHYIRENHVIPLDDAQPGRVLVLLASRHPTVGRPEASHTGTHSNDIKEAPRSSPQLSVSDEVTASTIIVCYVSVYSGGAVWRLLEYASWLF